MMTIKAWLLGTGTALLVPVLWILFPKILNLASGTFNSIVRLLLIKTLPAWKGHEAALKAAVEELCREVEKDVDDVSKESQTPPAGPQQPS